MMDELDHLLAKEEKEDDVVPSSGFAEAVMNAVRAAKAAPPAIPFPWTRALLALGALVVIIGVSAGGLIRVPSLPGADEWSFDVPSVVHQTIQAVATPESIWTITALLLATASIVAATSAGHWLRRR